MNCLARDVVAVPVDVDHAGAAPSNFVRLKESRPWTSPKYPIENLCKPQSTAEDRLFTPACAFGTQAE